MVSGKCTRRRTTLSDCGHGPPSAIWVWSGNTTRTTVDEERISRTSSIGVAYGVLLWKRLCGRLSAEECVCVEEHVWSTGKTLGTRMTANEKGISRSQDHSIGVETTGSKDHGNYGAQVTTGYGMTEAGDLNPCEA